jgi:putative ABC transport system ATP-binding protein
MASGSPRPLIDVRDLTRVYKMGEETVTALGGVSLSIEEGAFVAVMGPSGSGKSTFMNIIGCLDRPDSGAYRLADEEVSSLSADALAGVRSRRIGFVFQQFNLLERSDAVSNVALPMIYASSDRRERRRKAEAALTRVGLGDRMGHTPLQLSGGQQQRVAIARALVNSPKILLADEPTGALDSRTSLDIMALFQELNREGMTVLVVTHEQDVADFARRVVRFRDGKVIADKTQVPRDAAAALAVLAQEQEQISEKEDAA